MFRLQWVEGNCYDPSLQPEEILLKPTVTRLGRSNEYSDVVIDSVISPLMSVVFTLKFISPMENSELIVKD